MRRQDNYVRQELQKQFSEKHPVDMKFLKVPKVERFLALMHDHNVAVMLYMCLLL
jgi:hypothetical protein